MAYGKSQYSPFLIRRAFSPEDGQMKYDPVNISNAFNAGAIPFQSVDVRENAIKSFMVDSIQAIKIVAGTLVGFIIKTALNVGNNTDGVIIDEDGLRGYNADLGLVFNIPTNGDRPTFSGGVIEVSQINTPTVTGGEIRGTTIVGGLIKTSDTGQRTEISDTGIVLATGATSGTYGTGVFNDGGFYGSGALAFINNSDKAVPFYISAEQAVADFHYYNRSANPTGAAEVGDTAVIGGKLKICTTAGTPGTWTICGTQT